MKIEILAPKFVERVWGTTQLEPLFPNPQVKIGEVWFDAGPAFPLLIKFLFTSEKLSVQVHPPDDYARRVEGSRGKTEMWHILGADEGAAIALGFVRDVSEVELRAAIEDGSVESLLKWVPVKPGDTFFVEAGEVHAIGAGIRLCEIQQNSDVTYRLFDYGRNRPLHLERGLEVARTGAYGGERSFPVTCDHFTTELLELVETATCGAGCDGVLIVLEGSGRVGGVAVHAGNVLRIGPGEAPIQPESPLRLLHAKCGADVL